MSTPTSPAGPGRPTVYTLVNPSTGQVITLDNDSYIVPLDSPVALDMLSEEWWFNAPDNPLLTVIPVIESLEFEF